VTTVVVVGIWVVVVLVGSASLGAVPQTCELVMDRSSRPISPAKPFPLIPRNTTCNHD